VNSTSEVTIGGLVGTRWKPALSVEITDSIAIITFDLPNESVNKLNRPVKDEFVALVTRLERDTTVHAAVFLSGKPDVWIAGADIEEFLQLKTATDAERLSRDGQMLLDSVERLRIPIIAAIHGACLGGGLETALACHYRIATDHPKTILGLPEVQLGLIPGGGGTQRLPRRIGLTNALDLILTGKQVRASKYEEAGPFPRSLVQRAIETLRARYPIEAIDGIVSVPPTRSGPLVETFARQVAGQLGIAYTPVIEKVRETNEQKSLSNWVQKKKNVEGAFCVPVPERVADRAFLVIDDIYDSGYMLREVGLTLMRAGAKAVYPFTITRTAHSDDQ